MSAKLSLVIVGVGGQGTLLASRILGHIAVAEGLDVKVSEVHGMAQRGGNVISHVRMGPEVHSPLVEFGCADAVLAFEELEAARALPYLAPHGVLIASSQRIAPMSVLIGQNAYPEGLLDGVADKLIVDAQKTASMLGNPRVSNIVLMGALARRLPFAYERWKDAVAACVPPKTLEVNLKALESGYRWGEKQA